MDYTYSSGFTGWGASHVYLGSQLLAWYGNSTTYFVTPDHLGSTRVVTGVNQSVVEYPDYYPFGQRYSGDLGYTTHEFAGTIWDPETGLNQANFRQYTPIQNRWMTPDPAGAAAVDPGNPQSWNRYTYVLNNPLSNVDPLGLFCVWDDGSYDSSDDPGSGSASSCAAQGGTWYEGKVGDYGLSADWNPNSNQELAEQIQDMNNTPADTFVQVFGSPLSGSGGGGNGSSSWLGTFLNEFFKLSGGLGNVPTCAERALGQIAGEFFPFSPGGATVIQATAPAAQAMAFSVVSQTTASVDAYVAARGLTVPLRPSIVRGMIAQGAEGAVAVGARANLAVQTLAVDYAAVKSTIVTAGEARSGACAAAFPVF